MKMEAFCIQMFESLSPSVSRGIISSASNSHKQRCSNKKGNVLKVPQSQYLLFSAYIY